MASKIYKSMIAAIALCLLLCGCVYRSPSVPEGYVGELAQISDSTIVVSGHYTYVFFLEALDGELVDNAFERSKPYDGNRVRAVGFTRDVPARTAIYTIAGRMQQAAPIFALFRNYQAVEGDIEITLSADEFYMVNGVASKDYAAVWIEDINGTRVSEIIESHKLEAEELESQRAAISSGQDNGMTRRDRLLRISPGEDARVVEARLGKPDDFTITRGKYNFWTGRSSPDVTVYQYNGLGEITFHNDLVHRIDMSEASLSLEEIGVRLRNANASAIRQEAQRLYRNNESDSEMLDLVAQVLFEKHLTTEAIMIDAMAWFTRVLSSSGNPRYHDILDFVSIEASAKKLRGYAESGRDLLVPDGVDQFVPSPGRLTGEY